MSTKDQVRGLLLVCARAFSGKRGRTGLISFVLGQAGGSTVDLAREHGLGALHGVLHATPPNEIHHELNQLQAKGMVEVRETIIRDKTLPLLYLTDKGSFELERLRPSLNIPSSTARTPEKALLVLSRLGKLMEGLPVHSKESLPEHLDLGAKLFEQYIELLCKALDTKKEVPLSSLQAQRHFRAKLEAALTSAVFAELPEIEAQALRLITKIGLKHQLSAADFSAYYPGADPEELARIATARLLTREWQAKSPLLSVIGFLVLSEPH